MRIAAKPASAAHKAEVTRMPLLSKRGAVRRELAICGPSAIYRAIIRRYATWWMKRLSELRWNGNPCRGKNTGLLKHLFAVLDNEVASSQFGEFVSLDAPVEPMPKTWPRPWWKRKSSNFISPMTHSSWPISSLAVSIPMSQRSRNRRS